MSKYVTPIVIIIIAIAFFFFFTTDQLGQIEVAQGEIERYDDVLDKARRLNEIRDDLLAQYGELDPEKVERLERLLPNHVDNVRLLIEIDQIASEYDLALTEIGFTQPENNSGRNLGMNNSLYESIFFSFNVTATYDEFLQFAADMEESLRLVDIEQVSLEPIDGGFLYEFNITIKTYWLSEV